MTWPCFSRRHLLALGMTAPLWPQMVQAQLPLPLPSPLPSPSPSPSPSPGSGPRTLQFPGDLGSHPDHAIEWWYLTGRLLSGAREFGFQLTFFRSRVPGTQQMRSNFAAKQLIFAHAAITDVQGKKLLHDQRIAREGFGVAQAAQGDPRITLRDWSLVRKASGYRAIASGPEFGFDLNLVETQALLLAGSEAKGATAYVTLEPCPMCAALEDDPSAMRYLEHKQAGRLAGVTD